MKEGDGVNVWRIIIKVININAEFNIGERQARIARNVIIVNLHVYRSVFVIVLSVHIAHHFLRRIGPSTIRTLRCSFSPVKCDIDRPA